MTRSTLLAISLVLAATSLHATDQVSFTSIHYQFREDAGVGAVTIKRETGSPSTPVSVDYYSTINGATSSGTLTFGPGETLKVVLLTIGHDDVYDNDGSGFYVTLLHASGTTFGTPSTVDISLIDSTPKPILSFASIAIPEGNSGTTDVHLKFTLSAPLKHEAGIGFSAIGGTATPGSDYDPITNGVFLAARQTSAEMIVKIHGDTLPEPDETILLTADIYPGISWSGSITILNDDYISYPPSLQLARGGAGSVSLSTSVPTPTTDHVTLSSSDTSVATVPPFVDIPAGSMVKSFDITATGAGSAVITATMPPSRGSATTTTRVDVFTSTQLTFDKPTVDLPLEGTTTIAAHFDPPPADPVVMILSQTNPAIASIPPTLTIGANGSGSIAIHATSVGLTGVRATLPVAYGGTTSGFVINVTPPSGVAITRLDATSGPSTGGQHVTIYALGMSTRCSAMFDGVSGLNTSASASGSLTTNTPPHDAGTVDVSVRCGADTGTVPKAYTYTSVPSHLTRLLPTIGPAGGGVLVAVTGEKLRRGRCSLWFGGITATTLQNDQTTAMLVAAPPHAPGSVDVTLRCGSDISTLAGAFLYTGSEMLPQLAGVNPPSAAAGDRIIVGGSAFHDDDVIFFDNVAGLDMTSTSDQHFVTVPDIPPGNSTITLRDVSGHIAAGPAFRVLSPVTPQITSAPTRLLISSEFPITGTGFKRSLNFLLGGTVLQQVSVASTFAQLRLPDSIVPGTYQLTIANQNVTPRTIQVTDGISVTSVSIPCSSTEGGSMATIRGNGFAAGAVVAFGAADSADVTVLDAHTIFARVPPSSGLASETIIVTNPTGESAQLSNAFRYRWPDPGCSGRHRGAGH
jgi:hypothetical protein